MMRYLKVSARSLQLSCTAACAPLLPHWSCVAGRCPPPFRLAKGAEAEAPPEKGMVPDDFFVVVVFIESATLEMVSSCRVSHVQMQHEPQHNTSATAGTKLDLCTFRGSSPIHLAH
jgi:hypothetical protein